MDARSNGIVTDRNPFVLRVRCCSATPTVYGAVNNSTHDDGGRLTVGAPHSDNQRTAAVSAETEDYRNPSSPAGAPSEITNRRRKVINSTERVFSVPGTVRGATHDTQNQVEITPQDYPAHLQDYPALLERAANILEPTQVRVLSYLMERTAGAEWCPVTTREIARDLNRSRNGIRGNLSRLHTHGFIHRDHQRDARGLVNGSRIRITCPAVSA